MPDLYCSICGRAVNPTIHFKDHYIVDYYIEITGDTQEVHITGDDQNKPDMYYSKLLNHEIIIRCISCLKLN